MFDVRNLIFDSKFHQRLTEFRFFIYVKSGHCLNSAVRGWNFCLPESADAEAV